MNRRLRWPRRDSEMDAEVQDLKEQSISDLRKARLRAIEAITLGNRLREERHHNHFADMVRQALRGDE